MSYKNIADTFSITQDTDHFVYIKTLKKPRTDDQIWLAIEIIGSPKYAKSTAQNIIDTLEEVYYEKSNLDAYEQFEKSLKEVNIIINNIKEKRGEKAFGKINAIIALFSGEDLLLTQCNQAEAYLIRKGKLSMISEGLSGRSKDLFVNIANGEMLPQDKIIFATSRLLRLATHSQVVQIFSDGVTEAVDAIREMVLSESELSMGVACIHIKLMNHGRVHASVNKFAPYIEFAQKWMNTALDFISKKTGKKKLNVDKNHILMAIAAVVILLVISVSFLSDGKRNSALRQEYKIRIEAMNQDLHIANTKGYANDKETANAILEKVETEAREILDSEYFRSEVLTLLEKIQDTKDSINNTKRFDNKTPYIDLSVKKEDTQALGLMSADNKFFAYEYDTLHEIILDQVLEPKTIDNTEIVIAGTPLEDFGQLVFLTQSGRIIEYGDGQFQFMSTDDENWMPGVDITAYGKYIYLLSPAKNQIYKYTRLRSKYSNGSEYNLDANLKNALSFAIDGNIYILKKGGEIIKLYKSKQERFEVEDMGADISKATKIFTTTELDNLYVLDPVNRKVVKIRKTISGLSRYEGQYIFEDIEGIKDIYVDKNEDNLYLLTDQAIFQIQI